MTMGAPAIATYEALPHRVAGHARRTPTIVELVLEPLDQPLEFAAGQYVLLEDDGYEIPPRSYSIANRPRADGVVSLLVARVDGGRTSSWVHDRLAAGDEVRLSGPYGSFVDDLAATAPGLLLAAGSGLAPIRSLAEAGLAEGRRRALMLVFSARAEADVIDRERFTRWQAEHPRFSFLRTLTRAAGGPPPHGRIPALLPALCARLDDHDVFVAGAPGFVEGCARAAEALGAARSRVHTEVFYVEPPPWSGRPPPAPRPRTAAP